MYLASLSLVLPFLFFSFNGENFEKKKGGRHDEAAVQNSQVENVPLHVRLLHLILERKGKEKEMPLYGIEGYSQREDMNEKVF